MHNLMIKSLFWNIRCINSNGALERLQQVIRSQKLPFIAICEPFQKADKLNKFKGLLGYTNAHSNNNNQIWIFWDKSIESYVVDENEQHITYFFKWNGVTALISSIYAKCESDQREAL